MLTSHSSVRFRRSKRYPGHLVGSDGSVWTIKKWKNWTRMKGKPNQDGYPRVSLFDNTGRRIAKFVHVLVLEAFRGPKPKGMESRHLNGNPQDNRLDNLVWGTPKQNADDKRRHGTMAQLKGELNGFSKLSEPIVRYCRALYDKGYSQQSIADLTGIHQTTVSRVIRKEAWSHVV